MIAAGFLASGAKVYISRRKAALEPTLDTLVNNAGVAWRARLDSFRELGFDKVMCVAVDQSQVLRSAAVDMWPVVPDSCTRFRGPPTRWRDNIRCG